MESEIRNTRADSRDAAGRDADPRLLSYRNWALQSDLSAVLEAPEDLRRPADLGLGESAHAAESGGQGELARELEPDPELSRRTRYSLLLWSTAFVTELLSQFGPTGIRMSSPTVELTLSGIVAAIAITAITYPRLSGRRFLIVEQTMVAFAYPLIVLQCADTGGVESPYMVWWLFTSFYAASFFPARRAYLNAAVATILALIPAVYDDSFGQTDSNTALLLLIALIWTLTSSIATSRELERAAERAALFTALADPLTGVANQRSIERIVDAATRGGQQQFGLVLVDMHGLKGANAAFGFAVGDSMLIRLTSLMRYVCDSRAQVARIRGEEFAVYLPDADEPEVEQWRQRFESAVTAHNTWVRSRQPQISVTVASAVYPIDGARSSQLFERAGRRLAAQRTTEVEQPHEVNVSSVAGADRLIGGPSPSASPRLRGFVGLTQQLGVRWAGGAMLFGLYAAADGDALRYPAVMAGVAAVCAALSLACFGLRGSRLDGAVARVSDVASILLIVPILWASSGWRSPLVLTVFFPIVYYGQFLRGYRAYVRSGALIVCFTISFWAGGVAGVADQPVGPAGESLFATILAALIILTLLLQASRTATEDALRRVRDAANHDPVTGLLNVHAMREDLQAIIDIAAAAPSEHAPIGASGPMPRPAVTIADIDDFRGMIYRNGHQAADAVLRALTQRLQEALGGIAQAYHIERDEFVVIFKAESEVQALEVTERVERAVISHPDRPPRVELPVSFSFGTAVWRPGSTVVSMVDEASAQLAGTRAAKGEQDRGGGTVLL